MAKNLGVIEATRAVGFFTHEDYETKKPIETLILSVRSQKVILDADLAELYGMPTYRFNEAFKRNRQRFPDDFAFQLTAASSPT